MKSSGFTLIELVIVILIIAILAAMSTQLITLPVKSYIDLKHRTTLVDTADTSLRRMQRDIRRALPNSIRVNSSGTMLELLHTSDGGRYRASTATNNTGTNPSPCGTFADDILNFSPNTTDNCFEVMGSLSPSDPIHTEKDFLYIYNTDVATAYIDINDPSSNRRQLTKSDNDSSITFTKLTKPFPASSPEQHFFIVDTPITYYCELSTQQLWRYHGYDIQPTQAPPPDVNKQLQANKITGCKFIYTSNTLTRSGLVTLTITLDNTVTLMHQIHVDNVP
jgi:MSHA biogenesis protein MshO